MSNPGNGPRQARARRWRAALGLVLTCVLIGLSGVSIGDGPANAASQPAGTAAPALAFEPNGGAVDPAVHFLVHAARANLYFTADSIVLKATPPPPKPGQRQAAAATSVARARFVGASSAVRIDGGTPLPGKVNRFLGSDPSRWQTNLTTYAGIRYRGLYQGIDLVYDGSGGGLKGTYLVAPGADPTRIHWRYEGASQTSVDASGALQVSLGGTTITEHPPVAWQDVNGRQIAVAVKYDLAPDGTVGFQLGAYDRSLALTIDPNLSYATYLGGKGIDEGQGMAVDAAGYVYVVGTVTSVDYPTTTGTVQPTYGGGPYDAVLTKLDPRTSQPVFSTYLGGSAEDDGRGVGLDGSGNIYVVGYTGSSNFPTKNAFQSTYGGNPFDAFVAKLSPDGSALGYSTYLGGNGEDWGLNLAVDTTGDTYAIGKSGSSDFPTSAGSLQPAYKGGDDAFVAKLDPSGARVYATYLGGSGLDWGESIAVDASGNAYVGGRTSSADFPLKNAYQATNNGSMDSFVAKLDPAGATLLYATFLGGNGTEKGYRVVPDASGNIVVAGMTLSANFPTTAGAFQTAFGGAPSACADGATGGELAGDGYVAKLNPNANGAASLVAATYFGGSGCDSIRALGLDSSGYVYVAGWTDSPDLPVGNAFQPARAGGLDAFVAKLDGSLSKRVWSSYLGGTGHDVAYAMVVAPPNIYLTGYTTSADFPVTSGARAYGGNTDTFIARIADHTLAFLPSIPNDSAPH